MESQHWKDKISNPAQLGGIETAVLDNGTARGTRIAWVNTGTGLRYKVVIDRAMDIADAFYNQHSLAWLSHGGVSYPQPFSNRGTDWLATFGGGLMTTCGLTHVGGPESDQYGERGQHGPVSNIPAELTSIVQPDPRSGRMEMQISGSIKQMQVLGACIELKRTISGKLGQAAIVIHDEVTNCGNTPVPHMLLYHCNFGWPLVDEGADIRWQGAWQSPNEGITNKIFKEGNNFHKCSAPLPQHAGRGEEVAFIDIEADDAGKCVCGLHNGRLGIAVVLRFDKKQLPWLINWQHWGSGEYVTALEPATNPPIGQGKARAQNTLLQIAPGETKTYDLEFEVLHSPEKINTFIQRSGKTN